jgi:nitric oxide dioxygenase
MSLKVELLEESFDQVKPRAKAFSESFYDNLFEMYPAAKPLFASTDMIAQREKLIKSLVLIVSNLRSPQVLTDTLQGLGSRHVEYGALPEHYPLVGNALLATFEEYLGNAWTDETKQAWVEAYGAITEIMLDGANYAKEEVELTSVPGVIPANAAIESEYNREKPINETNWVLFGSLLAGGGILTIVLVMLNSG